MKKSKREEIIVEVNAIFIKLIRCTRLPFARPAMPFGRVGQESSQIYTNNN
jgi:hypothetical protein